MALSYRVTIPNLPQLQQALAKAPEVTRKEVSTAINKSLLAYQGTARQMAPIDRGTLRASLQIQPTQWSGNTARGSMGTNLHYAQIQEEGSGIYGPRHTPIRPKTASTLAWYSGGRWHFAKSVRGSRPRWFMKGSLERNQPNFERNFAEAIEHVVDAIARTA